MPSSREERTKSNGVLSESVVGVLMVMRTRRMVLRKDRAKAGNQYRRGMME